MSLNAQTGDAATRATTSAPQLSQDDSTARSQFDPATVPSVGAPTTITLRAPSAHTLPNSQPDKSKPAYPPPNPEWLHGTWHVTHSTLPMWKDKSNVRISYKPVAGASSSLSASGRPEMTDLDDLVEYQKAGAEAQKPSTVHGISRAVALPVDGAAHKGWAFSWRGKGWLMVASSKWEVLGYGEDEASRARWVVTYFCKTLFTPAGLDIYCREPAGVSEACLEEIKKALAGLGVESVAKLAEGLFEVPRK